jgi:pimeloyl-ACP methyl ester carboxylesterase
MTTLTSARGQSFEAGSTGAVVSRDGTTIGYRRFGRGPGVVILHGTMSSSYNHVELAEALAQTFTVYVPDRRGRGTSGPFGIGYSLQREVEDLDALLTETGAHDIFGVSSGAIIALRAALTLPAIQRAAIFEPPLFMPEPAVNALLERFDTEIAEGKIAAALITAMKGSQMGPPFLSAMPRWLAERLTAMAMNREDKAGTGGYLPMRTLAPMIHYDFELVREASESPDPYGSIEAQVLLLGGSKSPAFLKSALDRLEALIPSATRVELTGCDHAASWNADRGGRPQLVAEALRRFFELAEHAELAV